MDTTSYDTLARSFFAKLTNDLHGQMSNYAKVLFHWQNLSNFLPHLHRKINGCFRSYALTLKEVDWEGLYVQVLAYAQTANPHDPHLLSALATLQDAQHHFLGYLGDYFVDLAARARYQESNFLRAQAGDWAYKANYQIGAKYPMERPYDEASINAKMLSTDTRDAAIFDYYVGNTPYENALGDKAKQAEHFADHFHEQGGWGA